MEIPGFTNGSQYARLGIKYFGFSPLRLQPGENFQELPPLRPQAGVLRLQVPARALLTLTTMAR